MKDLRAWSLRCLWE